jgi:hypothetical protein
MERTISPSVIEMLIKRLHEMGAAAAASFVMQGRVAEFLELFARIDPHGFYGKALN